MVKCGEYIRLLWAYQEATYQLACLRDTLEDPRARLPSGRFDQLLTEIKQARLEMEQAKSTLAIHLTLHNCAEAEFVTG